MRPVSVGIVMAAMALAPSGLLARNKATPAMAVENAGLWFPADDYPVAAMRANESGRVVAELSLDETGKVAACTIKVSSGSAALDTETCRVVLAKGRYLPARNAAGVAIPDTVLLPVNWVLPKVVRQILAKSYSRVTRFEFSPAGERVTCTTEHAGTLPDWMPDDCETQQKMALVLRSLPPLNGRHVVVTFQSAVTFDGGSPPIEAHLATGQIVMGLSRARLEIDPMGDVTECTMIGDVLPPGYPPICGNVDALFAPDPGRAHTATILMSASGRMLP